MAKLKTKIAKLEDVEEKYRELYAKQDDGSYQLDADIEDTSGLKSALEKERKDRQDLERKAADLERKMDAVKDIDPAEWKRLKTEHDNLKGKKLWDEGQQDEYFQHRAAPLIKTHETTVNGLKEQLTANQQRIYDLTVETQIIEAAVQVGAQESALADIKERARKVFTVDEKGNVIALGPDKKPIYNDKDGKPISPKDWMTQLPSTAPHLFRGNAGGGNNNNGGGGGGNQVQYRSQMDTAQKTAFIGKHGQEKYNALPLSPPK